MDSLRHNTFFSSFFVTVLFIVGLCWLIACTSQPNENHDLVARVGPYSLSRERVEQPYIYNMGELDSAEAVKKFIKQWAFDKTFEIEAMDQLQSRQELDQLIDAYRSSLLTHLFEKQLIEQELDSVISQPELEEYYQQNKSQYVLKSSIIRLNFINIRLDHPDVEDIRRLWRETDNPGVMDSLIALCHESAEVFLLEDSVWYKMEELKTIVPGGILKSRSSSAFKEQIFSNDSAKYFLRVLEQIPDTEIAPLSFIEKQARKVILYRRKQQLIQDWRERIYHEALKANRVKLY